MLSADTAEAVSAVADEAANLIGEFDEGFSNRQTWHNAALAAIAVWFEDDELSGSSDEEQAANETLRRILQGVSGLLREGMASGALRAASIPHTMQTLIGMIIYHFASGDLGAEMLGKSLFAPAEVRRRKDEIKAFLHHGLMAGDGTEGE